MRSPDSVHINGVAAGAAWPYTSRPDDTARVWLSLRRSHDDGRVLWDPVRNTRTPGCWDDHGEEYPQGKGPDLYIDLPIPDGLFLLGLYFFEIDWPQYRSHRIELHAKETHGGQPPSAAHRDSRGRLSSTLSSTPLASSSVDNYFHGKYKRFAVQGPVDLTVRITREQSVNAIVSGIFLDKLAYPDDCPWPTELLDAATRRQGDGGTRGSADAAEGLSRAAEDALAQFLTTRTGQSGQAGLPPAPADDLAQAYVEAEGAYLGALRDAEAQSAEWYYRHLTSNYSAALNRLERFRNQARFSPESVAAHGLVHRAHHAMLNWPAARESLDEWADLLTTLLAPRSAPVEASAKPSLAHYKPGPGSAPVKASQGDDGETGRRADAANTAQSLGNTSSNCHTCPKFHSPTSHPTIDHEPSTMTHPVGGLRALADVALEVASAKADPVLSGYQPTRNRTERYRLASHLAENFAHLASLNERMGECANGRIGESANERIAESALSEVHGFAQLARAKNHPWLAIIALEPVLRTLPSPDTRHLTPGVRRTLATCYMAEQRFADAAREFALAIPEMPIGPEHSWSLRDYALCLTRCGRDAEAQAALAQLARQYPQSQLAPEARNLAAFALLQRGDPASALKEYQRLAQAQPQGPWRDHARQWADSLMARQASNQSTVRSNQ
jgi:tetratricopeptide (TPR) repeat protein